MPVKKKTAKRKLSPEVMAVVKQARKMFPKLTRGRSDWAIYLDAVKSSKNKPAKGKEKRVGKTDVIKFGGKKGTKYAI